MTRKNRTRSANINAAVWLIGLGLLWLTDLWWPGILILIGASMLVQVLVSPSGPAEVISPKNEPPAPQEAVEQEKAEDIWDDDETETPAFIQPLDAGHDAGLLPQNCPACGGPVAENAHKVEWLDAKTAKCPFCDFALNL